MPYVNLAENPPDPAAVILIPKDVALKRACIAISLEKNLLTVAMSDPLLFSLVQDLEFQTGYRIKQVVATRGEIVEAIQRRLSRQGAGAASAPAGGLASRPAPAARVRGDRRRTAETALMPAPEEESSSRSRAAGDAAKTGADHRPGRSGHPQRDQEPRQRHPHRADRKKA